MFFSFPPDFIWGVATSAYQIEGATNEDGRGPCTWDTFCHQPGKIRNADIGDIACDHYHRFRQDVALMARLKIPAYRFSISWSRVFPEGSGTVNPKGLDFYSQLTDELLAKNITPFACLHHFDLPQALQDQGGWPNRKIAYVFADYAKVVVQKLGDRINYWFTHNEPWVVAVLGYGLGEHAPGQKNWFLAFKALHHLLLSHGLAYDAIKAELGSKAQVGLTLNLSPVHPASSLSQDQLAAKRMDTFLNRLQLDPLLKAQTPITKSWLGRLTSPLFIKIGDFKQIAKIDLLGINYYSRNIVHDDRSVPLIKASSIRPKDRPFSLMWEIYPNGLYEILHKIWYEYRPRCKLLITENGAPFPDSPLNNSKVNDAYRITFIQEHLKALHRALKEGIPVKGYFHWSLLDNFEWALGYSMRFGLVYTDYPTQRRLVKKSGFWFKRLIQNNGFAD